MKVSEAIDQLEVGETVWVKATVDRINNEGKYIRVMPNASFVYLDGHDEISLSEPQAEKVEVPDFVAEWLEASKRDNRILGWAMNTASEIMPDDVKGWLHFKNYKNHEMFARAWLDGYTVKPKRWVVKKGKDCVLTSFTFFDEQSVNYYSNSYGKDYLIFTDHAKAEAVAVLVEGTVEEVAE